MYASSKPVKPDRRNDWHSLSIEAVAADLHTDINDGLQDDEARLRLENSGPNELPQAKGRPMWKLAIHQFASLMVGLLLLAVGVSIVLGDFVEAGAIVVVIVLNAMIGFATEWKAQIAIEELRKQTEASVRAIRQGRECSVPAVDLVPGDLVLLAAGDVVPADGRVFESMQVQIDESALTGESVSVSKSAVAVAKDAELADRSSMAYLGTPVTVGRCKILVTRTGAKTEMGEIGTLIAAVSAKATPLETKLAQLSRALLILVLVLCAVFVLVGWFRGHPLLFMIEVGISLAVAAVPEGLLAVTTMVLAVGMQRMAKRNALVRTLPAVETLGSTTIICSDKTGTLTKNEMTVCSLEVGGTRYEISGSGYAIEGEFSVVGDKLASATNDANSSLEMALRIGMLCGDAKIDRSDPQHVHILGDPTEAALLVAGEKFGLTLPEEESKFPRSDEVPFNSETQRMCTVHRTDDGKIIAFSKGSPAAMLKASSSLLCAEGVVPLTAALRAEVIATNDAFANDALRVLGIGYRELKSGYRPEDLSHDFVFVGLVGMMDPLRTEAKATVERCQEAGIRVTMITGDQQATAAKIAHQLGIDRSPEGKPLRAVHARELKDLDDDGLSLLVREASVFARVSPKHKLQIVDALQRNGEVVAMTGDGVNDAPALRKADIGIAMGIRGTEVAKNASSMVIADDNFATIVLAVEQGRIVYANLLRFIHYLFSTNLAEISTVFFAVMVGWPLPLGVMQILWLNLVTDIFPAMALAIEPAGDRVMLEAPRDPREPLMTRGFVWLLVWQGTLLASIALGAFALGLAWHGESPLGLRRASTLAFMTLAMAQVVHAFNARSQRRSIFSKGLFSNRWMWLSTLASVSLQMAAITFPPLQAVLHTTSLDLRDSCVVASGLVATVLVVELAKIASRLRRSRQSDLSLPQRVQ